MSKTWFITGASSGFGRSLTEKLLARGDRVGLRKRLISAAKRSRQRRGRGAQA